MVRLWSTIKSYVLEGNWMQILTSLVILTLYFVSFSHFLSWLLPEYSTNVTAGFVGRASKYLLLLAAAFYLVFIVFFRAVKGNRISFLVGSRGPLVQ